MFDVGFSEMLLLGLIALLVFGPERLPKVAREVGLWVRKIRAMASSVKQEINHELQLQELKDAMDKQKKEMDRMQQAVRNASIAPPEKPDPPESKPSESVHE